MKDKCLKQIISTNPQIDAEEFRRAQEATKALAEHGVTPVGFRLRLPFQRPMMGTPRSRDVRRKTR